MCFFITHAHKQQRCRPLRCSETVREKKLVVSFARDLFFAFAFSYCARRACLASETFLRRACSDVRDLDVSLPARERVKRSFQIAESRSGRRRDVGIGRQMTRAFGLDGVALNCGPFSAGECLECEWRARVGFSFFIEADRALGTMRRVVSRRASSRPSVALFGRGGRRRSFSRAMIARPRISVSSASFVVRGTFTYFCSSSSLVLHITQTRRLSPSRDVLSKKSVSTRS